MIVHELSESAQIAKAAFAARKAEVSCSDADGGFTAEASSCR